MLFLVFVLPPHTPLSLWNLLLSFPLPTDTVFFFSMTNFFCRSCPFACFLFRKYSPFHSPFFSTFPPPNPGDAFALAGLFPRVKYIAPFFFSTTCSIYFLAPTFVCCMDSGVIFRWDGPTSPPSLLFSSSLPLHGLSLLPTVPFFDLPLFSRWVWFLSVPPFLSFYVTSFFQRFCLTPTFFREFFCSLILRR